MSSCAHSMGKRRMACLVLRWFFPVTRFLLAIVFGIGCCGIGFSSPLLADDIPTFQGEEWVVVAKRLPQRPVLGKQVPASVTVITRKEIETLPVSNVVELLARLPGVLMTDSLGHGLEANVTLRGVGAEGRDVLVLLDGVRLNEPFDNTVRWKFLSLAHVDRIEVIRGGGSPLYGEGAFGGVINIITRDATRAREVTVHHEVGGFGEDRSAFHVRGGQGKWRVVFSGTHEQVEGYRENSQSEDNSFLEKAIYQHDDDTRFVLTYLYDKNIAGIASNLSETEQAENPRQKNAFIQESDQFEDRLKRWTLTFEDRWQEAIDVSVNLFTEQKDNHSQFFGSNFETDHNGKGLTTQVSVAGTAGGIFNQLTFGTEFGEYFINNPSDFGHNEIDRRTNAFFVENMISPVPAWQGVMGLRFDTVEFNLRDLQDPTRNAVRQVVGLSPHFGVTYQLASDSTVFVSVGRSFKAPSSSDLFLDSGVYGPNPEVAPTRSTDIEVGYRLQHAQHDFALAGFSKSAEDEILFNTYDFQNQNFNTVRHGGEATYRAKWLGGVQPFVHYAYLIATFSQGTFSGKRVPLSPEQQVTVGFDASLPRGIHWHTDYRTVSNYFVLNDLKNEFKGKDYGVVDSKLTWRASDRWSWYVLGKNLLNEKYSSFPATNGSAVRFNPNPERTALFGLEGTF